MIRRRKLARALAREGWTFERVTGSGHLRFRHTTGAVLFAANTPKGCNADHAALREARKRVAT